MSLDLHFHTPKMLLATGSRSQSLNAFFPQPMYRIAKRNVSLSITSNANIFSSKYACQIGIKTKVSTWDMGKLLSKGLS